MFDIEKFVGDLHDYIGRALRPLADRLRALEQREPQKGDPGPPGPPGRDAAPVDVAAVAKAIAAEPGFREAMIASIGEAVAKHLQDNPPPAGPPGERGEAGPQGERGPEGPPGPPGRDGRDGNAGRDGKDGKDGINGKDGAPGADGRDGVDGMGFDELEMHHDGERSVEWRLIRGDEVKVYPMRMAAILDRGVYKDGTEYMQGDAVTFAGSLWIAQRDNPDHKPGQGDGWRLAVKRGRDGRDRVQL